MAGSFFQFIVIVGAMMAAIVPHPEIRANDPDIKPAPVEVVPSPSKPGWNEITGAYPLTNLKSISKNSKWTLVDDANAELVVCGENDRAFLVVSAEGKYRILITTEKEEFRMVVVVGKPPAPAPTPDADPLVKKLQLAFDADELQLDTRRAQLVVLTALYEASVKLPDDATINTRADLMKRLRDLAADLGVVGLTEIRKIIAEELNSALGNVVAFDAIAKEKALVVLIKIRNALKMVK